MIRVQQWIRATIVIVLAMAVTVVAAEWLARQFLVQNVWLDWIEFAGILGFLCAALGIPFVSSACVDLQPSCKGVISARNGIVVIGAGVLAVYLIAYALLAKTGMGRLFYVDFVALSALAWVIAFAASIFALAQCRALYSKDTGHRQCISRFSQQLTISCAALIVAAVLGLLAQPANQPGYLLLGQVAWNLLSQDDFLALVLITCLFELNRYVDRDSDTVARSMTGLVSPVIPIVPIAALTLGLRGADAIATILVPAVGLALAVGLISVYVLRKGQDIPGHTDNCEDNVFPAVGSINARTFRVVGLFTAVALVIRGYARPVEAFALVGAVLLVLILLVRNRREKFIQLMDFLPQRIGITGLYVMAGGFLYLSSGVVGFQAMISNGVEWSGLSLISIVTLLFFLLLMLSRWLGTPGLFIVMLPIAPIALQTSGASLQQTFALVTMLIIVAPIGSRFLSVDVNSRRWPIFALLIAALTIMFSIVAFPQVVEFFPMRERFW